MKHNYMMKSFLIVFLTMLIGIGNGAWAKEVVITENFSSSNATTNAYDCSSNLGTTNNRNDFDYTWSVSGSGTVFKNGIKIGAAKASGSVQSSNILNDVPVGATFTVLVYAAVWNTDGGKVKVTYDNEVQEQSPANAAITATSSTYSSSDFADAVGFTYTMTTANLLNIASSAKRILIDKVVIVYDDGEGDSKTLSSIAVSGTPTKTTYFDGDKFSTDGLTVTGTYSDSNTETITNGITWNVTPETLTTGTTSVRVSATVSGIASPDYTVEGLTVNAIPEKTIAEFIAAEGGKCYLTGVVSNIANTTYGNYDLTDESGTIYVYGTLTSAGTAAQFASLGVAAGDKIKVLADEFELYGGKNEAKNVVFVENLGDGSPTLSSIAVSGTPTTKEYMAGKKFSTEGLVVTGTYSDASTQTITEGITWSVIPETLTEGLTSVSVTATVNGIASPSYTVNGLTVTPYVPTYADTYTSGENMLSVAGGTSASTVTVKWNGADYDGIKAGTSSNAGVIKVKVPAGTKTLHMHIAGWSNEGKEVTVTGLSSEKKIAINPDGGVASNSPFTLQSDPETNHYYSIDINNTAEVTLTITATSGKRFVLFGVNAEEGDPSLLEQPAVTPASTTLSIAAEGKSDVLAVTWKKITTMDVKLYNNAQCTEAFTAGWATATLNADHNVAYTISANTESTSRTVYMLLSGQDSKAETYTAVVEINQERPVCDYVDIPWTWAGGTSAELKALDGVKTDGLGSDYAASHAPYRVKFDTDKDYIQVKTQGGIGVCTINVKMIGGTNTSYIIVKGSEDGVDFTEVQTLTIAGGTNDILSLSTTEKFSESYKYVRFEFKRGSNVGVGGISIVGGQPVQFKSAGLGYATVYSEEALQLPAGIEAYYASAATEGSLLAETIENVIPARTAAVLKYAAIGESDKTIVLPYTEEAGTPITNNVLEGTSTDISSMGNVYVFSVEGDNPGFYKYEGAILAANKAYYHPASASVKGFVLDFGGDTTGIKGISTPASQYSTTYDLQGRRANAATRGLFIQNGMKILK